MSLDNRTTIAILDSVSPACPDTWRWNEIRGATEARLTERATRFLYAHNPDSFPAVRVVQDGLSYQLAIADYSPTAERLVLVNVIDLGEDSAVADVELTIALWDLVSSL